MAIKKRTNDVAKQASKLADELADKKYGSDPISAVTEDEIVRTTISLPRSMLHNAEDLAKLNKRAGVEPKSVSAIIRESLLKYMK